MENSADRLPYFNSFRQTPSHILFFFTDTPFHILIFCPPPIFVKTPTHMETPLGTPYFLWHLLASHVD